MTKEPVDNETARWCDAIRKSRRDNPPPMCDRCEAPYGLYQFAPGRWRCPACIWKEAVEFRTELVKVRAELEQFETGLPGLPRSRASNSHNKGTQMTLPIGTTTTYPGSPETVPDGWKPLDLTDNFPYREVECIRHSQGCCAIASGQPFDPSYFPWKTVCGQNVMLPLGGKRCRPTCVVCKEVLNEHETKHQQSE